MVQVDVAQLDGVDDEQPVGQGQVAKTGLYVTFDVRVKRALFELIAVALGFVTIQSFDETAADTGEPALGLGAGVALGDEAKGVAIVVTEAKVVAVGAACILLFATAVIVTSTTTLKREGVDGALTGSLGSDGWCGVQGFVEVGDARGDGAITVEADAASKVCEGAAEAVGLDVGGVGAELGAIEGQHLAGDVEVARRGDLSRRELAHAGGHVMGRLLTFGELCRELSGDASPPGEQEQHEK